MATTNQTKQAKHPEVLERLPTTYLVDTAQGRQTQIAATLDVREDGTLIFHDDDDAIVAAYGPNQWQRVQSEKQSKLTPSA